MSQLWQVLEQFWGLSTSRLCWQLLLGDEEIGQHDLLVPTQQLAITLPIHLVRPNLNTTFCMRSWPLCENSIIYLEPSNAIRSRSSSAESCSLNCTAIDSRCNR